MAEIYQTEKTLLEICEKMGEIAKRDLIFWQDVETELPELAVDFRKFMRGQTLTEKDGKTVIFHRDFAAYITKLKYERGTDYQIKFLVG